MADAVSVNTIHQGPALVVLQLTNISDGTGETDVAKLVLANYIGLNGVAPTRFRVLAYHAMIQGMTMVRLEGDHTADSIVALIPAGVITRDFSAIGGLLDPAAAGGNGNLILTTVGAINGGTYDILIVLELH